MKCKAKSFEEIKQHAMYNSNEDIYSKMWFTALILNESSEIMS